MKYLKVSVILLLIILFSMPLTTYAKTSQDIAYEMVENYLKSYQTKDTEKSLKLKSYKIEKVEVVEETDNEIICIFSAKIKPKSLNYRWSTTDLMYYIRIEQKNNQWEITEMATSPLELSSYTYEENNSKSIVYKLAEDYLKSKNENAVADTEKIKYYEIESISINSENEKEITSSVVINTIPYNKEISFSNFEKNTYDFTLKKVNNEWKVDDAQLISENKPIETNNYLSFNYQEPEEKSNSFLIILVVSVLIIIILFFIIKKILKRTNK